MIRESGAVTKASKRAKIPAKKENESQLKIASPYIEKSGHSLEYKQINAKISNRSAALKECPSVNRLI